MDDRHARHRRRGADLRRRPTDGYRTPSLARFSRLIDDAVASLPPGLLAYLDNVGILVADVPPADGDEILLGRYEGVPQPQRGGAAGLLPDVITIYRRPHELRARSKHELAAIVLETVVHEVAHHFGIDDDRLDELGWG